MNCLAFLKSVQYFCLVLHRKVQCLPDFMHHWLCASFSVSLRTWGYPVIWWPTKISHRNMNCLPFKSLWAVFLLPEGQERCPRPVSSSLCPPLRPLYSRLPCKKQHSSSALYLFLISISQIFHLPWFSWSGLTGVVTTLYTRTKRTWRSKIFFCLKFTWKDYWFTINDWEVIYKTLHILYFGGSKTPKKIIATIFFLWFSHLTNIYWRCARHTVY